MHQHEPELVHNFTPVSRTQGSVFDTITTAKNDTFYVFKSENFPLNQAQTALKLKFWVLNSELTDTYILVHEANFNLASPRIQISEIVHAPLSVDNVLGAVAHSKSCAGVTVAINGTDVSFFQIQNEYWIPFWGYNDTGTVLALNTYHRFAFYYVCDKNHFDDFKLATKDRRIKYATKFPFHDEPQWDSIRLCWTHKDIGFPI